MSCRRLTCGRTREPWPGLQQQPSTHRPSTRDKWQKDCWLLTAKSSATTGTAEWMGMGTWSGPARSSSSSSSSSHPGQHPTPPFWQTASLVLTSLIALLAFIPNTASAFGLICSGESCCPIQPCMDLFNAAQDSLLGKQDSFEAPPLRTLSPEQQHNHCVARRTFVQCLRNITRQCKGDLQYHTAEKGIEREMKRMNCSQRGPVFDPSTYVHVSPDKPLCSYEGKAATTQHRHCAFFGQPHLVSFMAHQQTCALLGAWPLLDNKYLTVQVTNQKLSPLNQPSKNVTTSVTVMIKKEEKCGGHHFVMYQAQADLLPSAFDDGRTHFGRDRSVQLTEVRPKEHVEIYLRYIDTTVVVRRIANYLSVAIKMPQEIVQDNRTQNVDGIDLCRQGCPRRQQINYEQLLGQAHKSSHHHSADSEIEDSSPALVPAMSASKAVSSCREEQVVDFYFDSCVYDLMSTADRNFSLAAYWAQQDAVRLCPQTLKVLTNRTSIDIYHSSAAPSLHPTSWHCLSLLVLLLCIKSCGPSWH